MDCSMPGFPVLHYLPEFVQTHVHCISFVIHLILYHPLLLLPSNTSSIRIFSNESTLHIRWPKYWSFSFSISPSNEYSGWFPLGWTGLISLLSKGLPRVFPNTTVWKHQFYGTHLYGPNLTSMTTGKTIALTRRTFDGKVMSLLFNILSRLIIVFLPRSKHILISWLWFWSPSKENLSLFPLFPLLFTIKGWDQMSC